MTTERETENMTAAEIAHEVNTGNLSPVQVTQEAIDRIELRNPSINAVTFKGYEDAMDRARSLSERQTRGETLGPLAGVPSLMKDLFGLKPGWPATLGGLSLLKDNISAGWSTFPARVEAAGSIVLGETNSPVYGFRGTTDNATNGPTCNPFNRRYNPGGSSGGSAASVADGMVPLAGATDGGGSIRIPSAWSGTVGFQPSPGRVPFISRPNAFGLSLFLYEGPITRTVQDSALAMNALSGHDKRDPLSTNEEMDFTAALSQGIRGKKIAYTPDYGLFPVEKEVRDVVERQLRVFEELGGHVEAVDFRINSTQSELSDVWNRTTAVGVFESLESLKAEGIDVRTSTPNELPESMMRWVDSVPGLKMQDLVADQRTRTHVYDVFNEVFSNYDYVISPTLACSPVPNTRNGDTQGPSEINGEPVDPLIGWCMTYLTNFTGNPSATVPAGMCNGLPVGLLVIGRRGDDLSVMSAISAFEEAQPWKGIYQVPQSREL